MVQQNVTDTPEQIARREADENQALETAEKLKNRDDSKDLGASEVTREYRRKQAVGLV